MDPDIELEISEESPIEIEIVEDTPIEMELVETGPQGEPGAGEYTDFIFNSSGAQEDNRFNNWLDLFAAMPEDRIRITVQFEQNEIWDEPGTYDLTRVTFSGNGNLFVSGAAIEINPQDGVVFSSVDGFVITNGIFFRSQSHEPLAIIDSGSVVVKANYLAAFATDYCEIFREQDEGAFVLNMVPGGAIANLFPFTGTGYEVVNLQPSNSEGFQLRFGGFGSGIANNTVRGSDSNFIIIKEDIGYLETETTGLPGLGNLDSTHENYTGGSIGKLVTVRAAQLDIDAIEGMVSRQVQAALEELAARPIGTPDEAYTEVDITDKVFNFLNGEYLSMGTGGMGKLRWQRIGRQIQGFFSTNWATDADLGSFCISSSDLPAVPRNPVGMGAEVGMFCYLQCQETSEGAGDGFLIPLGSVVTDIGLGSPILFLVQLSGSLGDGGLSNIFNMNGNPVDLTGRQFSLLGRFNYEAAEAEGNLLSITGDFTADAEVGTAYSSSLPIVTSEEDQLPIGFEVTDGALPDGLELSIDGDSITLAGDPSVDGEFTFTVLLTDALGQEYSKAFTVTVTAPVVPLSINIPGNWANTPQYHQRSETIIVELENEGLQAPLTMTIVSGSLPPSYGINYSQGGRKLRFNGNSDFTGTYNFRVRLVDALGTVYEKDMSCTVEPSAPPATNPELDPQYLGTWSPNSHNIQFAVGGTELLDSPGVNYSANNGDILKVRSANANISYLGASTYYVEIGDYIQYFGTGGTNGGWQYMIYN